MMVFMNGIYFFNGENSFYAEIESWRYSYLFVDGDIFNDDGEGLFIFGTYSMDAFFHAMTTKRVPAIRDHWSLLGTENAFAKLGRDGF